MEPIKVQAQNQAIISLWTDLVVEALEDYQSSSVLPNACFS